MEPVGVSVKMYALEATHRTNCQIFFFFTNLTDVCTCLKKPKKKKDHKQPQRSIKSQPHRCGKHWGTEKAEQHLSRTFLLHSQLDVLGDQNWGRKEVELKSAKNVALVDPAVIIRDIDDPNGQVLQVLAPIPEQTAFKRSIHLNKVVILKPVYLKVRDSVRETPRVESPCASHHIQLHSWTYVSLVGWDIFFLCGHVVPINPRPRFDFLPLHTGDAGQLHGFPEDRFCCRRHVHTHRLAHMDWKGHLRQ